MKIKEVDLEKTELFSIGRQYSKNVLAIHFVNLPNQNNKYIYYKIDDIEKEIPLVSDLFIVSRPLTLHSGEVKAQIIVRDETNETIELTKNFTMIIQPSNYSGIGEDENYPDDPNIKNYFVKIEEKVNSFEELANLVQTKLDNGDFVGAKGPKGEKGDPGEKGEPGDVTDEYRNLASQIEQNASDAQTSATNAQTSASNAKKALDDTKEFANQAKSELNQIKTDTNTLKDEANTSAVNAKSSETKAKEYADNLQSSTDDISKLKEDLANKLPKSPADWNPWTAEEQAVARDRIGINEYDLIDDITIAEDVDMFSYNDINLNRILVDITISQIPDEGITVQMYVKAPENKLFYIGRIAKVSNMNRVLFMATCYKGVIVVNAANGDNSTNANRTLQTSMPVLGDKINGITTAFALPAKSTVRIYGVRA